LIPHRKIFLSIGPPNDPNALSAAGLYYFESYAKILFRLAIRKKKLLLAVKKLYFGKVNVLDSIVLILLAYGLISGFMKGLVLELAGLIAFILGLMGAFKFSSLLRSYLGTYVDWSPKTIQAVSFILLFLVIIYAISLLAKMITKTLKLIALGFINRIAGGLFGLLKWGVILSALTLVFQEVNTIVTLFPESTLNTSKSYAILSEFGSFLFDWISQSETLQEQQLI
jgi:membrane protein required for colicin V production